MPMTYTEEQQKQRVERKAKRFWVVLILAFFALDISIAAIAISMAAGDPSFRSIPGYGNRAVAWDERQALKDAWDKHQWTTTIDRVPGSTNQIVISIKNSDQSPVTGCKGHAKLFHFTRVAQQVRGELSEVEPGRYLVNVDVAKPGLWNIELNLETADHVACSYEQTLQWSDAIPIPIAKNHGTPE